MKRILICTPSHTTTGGVERILESLHRLLPGRGFEVVFGLARGRGFNDPARFAAAYPGIRWAEIDGTSGTRAGRLRGLRRVLAATDPDIVLVARLYDAYQAVCERKARHAGRPRLATTIQTYEEEYIADARDYARHLDLCVTGGELTARALVEWAGLPRDRVCSIPGAIRPPARPTVRDHARDPLRLAYVGRLEQPQKRIRELPDVLRRLDGLGVPFEFLVVGTGPEEAWLRQRLEAAGLAGRVTFRPWVSTEELYQQVYPQIDVFVHLAVREGAPIALAEALLHGAVPVVSTFTGCRSEGLFVHEQNALLFPVGDTARAAAQVERLHRDRGLLARLSRAAARSANRVRSPEQAADAWAAAVKSALDRPPAPGREPPALKFLPAGRLEDWGLPPRWAEGLRRLTRRRFAHASGGAEWPHCSGLASATDLEELAAFAARVEGGAELGCLATA